MRLQSSTVGARRPAARAIAGMCSSRFVEPPNAACTSIAFSSAFCVRIFPIVMPSACSRTSAIAERCPSSIHAGSPDGASALCGSASPNAFGDDLRRRRRAEELTAAPRRSARATAHLLRVVERDEVAREARVEALHLPGVLAADRRQRHAARHDDARQLATTPASASIVAGSPLSHVAMPITPDAVGSERMSRRITIAASLR